MFFYDIKPSEESSPLYFQVYGLENLEQLEAVLQGNTHCSIKNLVMKQDIYWLIFSKSFMSILLVLRKPANKTMQGHPLSASNPKLSLLLEATMTWSKLSIKSLIVEWKVDAADVHSR